MEEKWVYVVVDKNDKYRNVYQLERDGQYEANKIGGYCYSQVVVNDLSPTDEDIKTSIMPGSFADTKNWSEEALAKRQLLIDKVQSFMGLLSYSEEKGWVIKPVLGETEILISDAQVDQQAYNNYIQQFVSR
jgi:hypothetical protein